MRVKKYIVDNMPEALVLIRKDLGHDAVILDQKKIKVGGFLGMFSKQKLEVIAAIEPKVKKNVISPEKPLVPPIFVTEYSKQQTLNGNVQSNQSQETESNPVAINFESLREPIVSKPQVQTPASTRVTEEKMMEEIQEIKGMFVRMMCKHSNDDFPENIKKLYNHLVERDIEEALASSIISNIMEKLGSPRHVAQTYLNEILQNEVAKLIEKNYKSQPPITKQQIYAFVGPTGVGKTTTIAKLAAYYLLEKKLTVGLITADTYRIAAVDQLRTYANILNIPIEIVITHDDMKKAIYNLKERDIILIDTAGRNYRKDMYLTELKSLLSVAQPDESYLVLSMTTKQKDMNDIANSFKTANINNIIFTKIDETSSYGAILNMLQNHNKTLSFLTNGQNVPEDIVFINPKNLAKLIVGELNE
ncbi:flagellar biosynthesis protein FlhF [Desulfuribacillus stibiiarsenatis]|uniref:Flagellar biosynthesis protein FlhF n=1 Tax=Desulfuribacillus stibiiarsenatis TaxID=1390249 RepID=A0A1E5L6P4_9FIRM|nr:flagellar biosynthesis protein FlhF [Desulfuribacillus stibiiarsenatis]OEH85837.1 flagellar biosynthesis protein FlhF [Desulfuribacillus stibiiarsenatis]